MGFEHGGWAVPYSDEAMVAKMGERMGEDRAFLFGRRTYEQLLASWNARAARSRTRSTTLASTSLRATLTTRLDWPNSTLLHGDVPGAVAELKASSGTNLVIMGSGVLIGSLMAADLIDEYLLMIHPLVLGSGRRLFAGGTPRIAAAGRAAAPRARACDRHVRACSGIETKTRGVSMKQTAEHLPAPGDPPPPEALERSSRDVRAVDEEMRAPGAWVFTGGLHPPSTATGARPGQR